MSTLFDISSLLPIIEKQQSSAEPNCLILTPNQRLTAKIQAAYGLHQQAHTKVWQSPNILPISGWIHRLWDELQDQFSAEYAVTVINSRQELLIWERIISDDPNSSPLIKPSGLAKHCQQALNSLELWQIDPTHSDYQQWSNDSDPFPAWCEQFKQRCKAQTLISTGEQLQLIIDAFGSERLAKLDSIQLLGFQDIPPLHQQLLQAGSNIHGEVDLPSRNQSQSLIAFTNAEEELSAAARWAQQQLENSTGSIGIVIPDLHQRRGEVERTLRKHLEPGFLSLEQSNDLPPFNLSIGQSLYETPIIQSAVQCLLLLTQPLAYENLSRFIHTPFLPGFDKELRGRVELEQQLRSTGQNEYWLSQIIQIADSFTEAVEQEECREDEAQQPIQTSLFADPLLDEITATNSEEEGIKGCPLLLASIQTLKDSERPTRQKPSEWAQWCYQTLERIGWPGDRTCSSVEYQQLNQWYELLSGLTQFDDLSGSVTLANALELIRKETQSAIFQPQTEDSQLQILGPLEAAGLQFSHLWIMGLSDDQWPASPAPNPLIPLTLQREHQMPHATAERELSFASDLINTFTASSENVVGSYPQWQEDQPLRPSGLVKHFPLKHAEALNLSATSTVATGNIDVEFIDTTEAPPVSEAEKSWLRGSTGLLKQQALCPFTAFAQYRLDAYPLEAPINGLSALDRGNLIHSILEYFWQTHKTQANLVKLTHIERIASLEECCRKAVSRLNYFKQGSHQKWMGNTFWQLESERLIKIVDAWLDQETHRSSFTVFATEDAFQTELSGLTYKLRIDRIDQLDDGSHVLIDYKTGDTKPKQWLSERPQEPQLPLYAVACHKNISAITFASVNAKQQSFAGLKASDGYIAENIDLLTEQNSDADNWNNQVQRWREVLDNLSASFMQGYTAIDPLTPQTYGYSGLAPFARLYELNTLDTGSDIGGSDE